ncbi:RNA-directed DNA polymerase [Saprospira grandis str. Lewin]|uniref:RNA-directed DNA polymerase n=2 Tax=Saprospira TaxID=1007 RepID=H6L3B1_SAPGL|nr:RNA-directed DNA polymerase [Saprospira grandis str. Lewin]
MQLLSILDQLGFGLSSPKLKVVFFCLNLLPMSDHRMTRQQIYDRIRQTSKEEYILEEMKRLGFWDTTEEAPKISEELIQKKGALRRELRELMEKQRMFRDKERMLAEMRKKRMADALARREETKERRKAEKEARAKAWQEKKERSIVFLGKDYSAGLSEEEADLAKLAALNLPAFKDIKELAEAMDISVGRLRYLCFQRKLSTVSHYERFYLAKKTGGKRLISAPRPMLKNAQYWLLENVLARLEMHEAAHGFVPERSIVSNAKLHEKKELVINMDLKDFFPTVTYPRVKGMFKGLGYSEQQSIIFALLTTEPEVDQVEIDGQLYYAQKGERYLPQGAPTSPAITNWLCRRMDRRFEGVAKKLGWTYSRYADDLSFSANDTSNISRIIWQAQQIIQDEGFVIHPKKLKIMRKGRRQEVTGLTVNEQVAVDRKTLKKFRACLHTIETKGYQAAEWGQGFILASIKGFANYVRMVQAEKGQALCEQVDRILAKEENKQAWKAYFANPSRKKYAYEAQKQQATIEANAVDFGSSGLAESLTPVDPQQKDEEQWWSLW